MANLEQNPSDLEPDRVFEADPEAFRDVGTMIAGAAADDGLDAALGVVAGALVAVLSFLVASFGRVEAKAVITGAVDRYFARLTQ